MFGSFLSTPPPWLGYGWLAPHYLGWLAKGALLTAWLSLLVCVFATLVGLLLTLADESKRRWVSSGTRLFVSLHRNTPLLVQILLWYFGVGGMLPEELRFWLNAPHRFALPGGLALSWPSYEFLSAFVALTLYSASFVSEEIRAGLNTVGRGQRDAGRALGLRTWQIMRHIVFPQALAAARRPLIGQYTAVIKNTSLTMAIGVAELSYSSRQVESESLLAFQAFAVATLLYLALVLGAQFTAREDNVAWRAPR
ncbi:MAG: amino acid ABC transporter permease [Propionivibrio sp.]